MCAIAPVLRSVLRQYLIRERERFAALSTADAVRRLQFGWIMLDQRGHVLDSDEQGAHLLAHSGILGKSANGRLAAHEKELEHRIGKALAKIGNDDKSRPHAITLNRDPWFDMLLVPIRSKSAAQAAPAIIAYVHSDSWRFAAA
jgi:hypothetical protein